MIQKLQQSSSKPCSCHSQQATGGGTGFNRRRQPARLGDASNSDFLSWLGQQNESTQTAFFNYQSANPSSAVPNDYYLSDGSANPIYQTSAATSTASPAASTSLASSLSSVNWTLVIAGLIGAVVVVNLISAPGGRRR
jgi:hypothetical protein